MAQGIEERVLRVLKYCNENPASDLSLDRLAELGLMSRFHWHRVFQALTGETCAQTVRRIRMHRAATWLLTSDLPIAQIAASVGYPNIQSFTRSFSDRFGVPPATFRSAGNPCPPLNHTLRGNFHMFKVEIDQIPERRLAALLHQGSYTGMGSVFGQLFETAAGQNLWPRVGGIVGVHYDDPNVTSEENLRAHAGLIIGDKQPIPQPLEEVNLDAGECAVLHYKGPYTAIKVAYDFLYGDWLPKSGREPAAEPPYELYLNDPSTTEESELLTDIVLKLSSQPAAQR